MLPQRTYSAYRFPRLAVIEGISQDDEWPSPKPLGHEESLYFLHIHKTAGTSLYSWLSQKFSSTETQANMLPAQLATIPAEEVNRKRFIFGHFGVSFAKHYRDPSRTITWLREPIDRTFSEYFFWKRMAEQNHGLPRAASLPSLVSLEECLGDHEFARTRANFQTLSLAAEEFTPHRYFLSDEELIERARDTLNTLEFVGLVEHMQLSVDMLNWRMGWRPVRFDIHENRADRSTTISATGRELAREMNRLDLEIYAYSQQNFLRRFQQYLDDITRTAEQNRLRIPSLQHLTMEGYQAIRGQLESCLWSRYQQTAQILERVSELEYTFDLPLIGEGWGEREGQRTIASLPHRWTNKARATIDFPLRRDQPLKFRFRVVGQLGQSLKLYADETPMDLTRVDAWGKFGIHSDMYEGIIPTANNWETRVTTLAFEVSNLVRPCDLNSSVDDCRQLGVAIDWISIEP